MKRLLAFAPDDWSGLTHVDALAVNEVDVDGVAHVAVYFDDDEYPLDDKGWSKIVESYKPAEPGPTGPSLDEVAATIDASPDLSDEVKAALATVIDVVRGSAAPAALPRKR